MMSGLSLLFGVYRRFRRLKIVFPKTLARGTLRA